jgi:hypothetical protein
VALACVCGLGPGQTSISKNLANFGFWVPSLAIFYFIIDDMNEHLDGRWRAEKGGERKKDFQKSKSNYWLWQSTALALDYDYLLSLNF